MESRLLMASGIFFLIEGGWLLCEWTYRGESPGFKKGLKVPDLRLSSTSRYCTVFLFASMVIWSPNLLNV